MESLFKGFLPYYTLKNLPRTLDKKMKFSVKDFSINVTKSAGFTEEVFNGKIHVLCSDMCFLANFVNFFKKNLFIENLCVTCEVPCEVHLKSRIRN